MIARTFDSTIVTPSPGAVSAASRPAAGTNGRSTTLCARNLRSVQGARPSLPERGVQRRRGGERHVGIRQPAAEPHQPSVAQDLNLAERRQQPAASRRLHGHAVEHPEMKELDELDRRYDAFVHEDRQRTLQAERLVALDAVRANGCFENIHAGIGEARRHLQGCLHVVAAVGVGPQKRARGERADRPAQLHVEVGRGADLHVEVLVPLLASGGDQRLDVFQAGGAHGPAECQGVGGSTVPEFRQRNRQAFAEQIVQRDIDPGFGYWLPGRERGRNGVVHDGMGTLDVGGVPAHQLRCEIADDRRCRRLEGLFAPLGNRHALAPAHDPVFIGDAHQGGGTSGGGAVGPFEELEPSCHRIAHGEHVDAGDA